MAANAQPKTIPGITGLGPFYQGNDAA